MFPNHNFLIVCTSFLTCSIEPLTGASLPSVMTWIATSWNCCCLQRSSNAYKWSSCPWTHSLCKIPNRWSVEWCFLQCSIAPKKASLEKKLLSAIALFILTSDWYAILPEPSVRCHTSEFPWYHSGSPTASPLAAKSVCGYSFSKCSIYFGCVSQIALSVQSFLYPRPSRIISNTLCMKIPEEDKNLTDYTHIKEKYNSQKTKKSERMYWHINTKTYKAEVF
jgi:hypothetical protein